MALRETAALSKDGGAVFLQQENSCWQIQIPSKITTECGDVLRVPLQVAVSLGGISQAGCWEVVGCLAGLCPSLGSGAVLGAGFAELLLCFSAGLRSPPRPAASTQGPGVSAARAVLSLCSVLPLLPWGFCSGRFSSPGCVPSPCGCVAEPRGRQAVMFPHRAVQVGC